MNTHKAFWQMITFSPWLYALNVFLQLFRSTFLLLPGLIVFAIFNVLTAKGRTPRCQHRRDRLNPLSS